MDIESSDRRLIHRSNFRCWLDLLEQSPQFRLTQHNDSIRVPLTNQRYITDELNRIAVALLSMKENALATEIASIPFGDAKTRTHFHKPRYAFTPFVFAPALPKFPFQ